MTETEKVVTLIKELQCWRLGNWDGCCCSDFKVRNVEIEIACGKGRPKQIIVRSRSMDYPDEASLTPIMQEVAAQVAEQSGRAGPFAQYIEPCA